MESNSEILMDSMTETESDQAASASVDKSSERIQRMFGAISSRYDFLNHFLSGGTDFYWRWQTVRRVRSQGSDPILDVCCGTGDLAFAFWKKGARKVPVVGTDFTAEMIDLANKKRDRLQQGNSSTAAEISFREADTLALPFPDNEFQIVSVAFGLRNVSDTASGLREMVRVCKPEGRIAVLEFSLPQNRLIRAVYLWYFRNILPRIGQLVARNSEAAYKYLPTSVAEFPQGDELADIMRSSGLESVTWKTFTFGIATLYVGHKPGLNNNGS